MNEADFMRACMIEASKLGATVWRNNQGAYKHPKGYFIKYGVCNPGGSDLIGIYKGKFLALETKYGKGKATPEQLNFVKFIHSNGGLAGIVKKIEDVKKVLDGELVI